MLAYVLGFSDGGASGARRCRRAGSLTIQQPELSEINDLMSTVSQTATAAGLSLIQAGASYRVDDCESLEDEAQQAAIDDARQRAARLAEQLGVTTGQSLLASDVGVFGGPGIGGGCAPFGASGSYTSFGGPGGLSLSIPDFDSSSSRSSSVRPLGLAMMGLPGAAPARFPCRLHSQCTIAIRVWQA